jgi:hypothetical protein
MAMRANYHDVTRKRKRPGRSKKGWRPEGSAAMFISRMKLARHLVLGVLQVDSLGGWQRE